MKSAVTMRGDHGSSVSIIVEDNDELSVIIQPPTERVEHPVRSGPLYRLWAFSYETPPAVTLKLPAVKGRSFAYACAVHWTTLGYPAQTHAAHYAENHNGRRPSDPIDGEAEEIIPGLPQLGHDP